LKCNNSINEESEEGEKEKTVSITIGEFTKKYCNMPSKSIDNKRSNILIDFAKISPFLSSLNKIGSLDKKDITAERYYRY